jgi:hypothetical protein
MRTIGRFMAGLGVLMLVLTAGAVAHAEPAATGKGTIKGKVLKDGQPLANTRVALVQPQGRGPNDNPGEPRGPRPDGLQAGPGGRGPGGPGGPGGDRPPRPEPIAETVSDANGNFTFTNIAVGTYVVVSGERGVGMGRARVKVVAGETATVEVNVQPRPQGGQPGGGGRGNRN